MEMKLFYLGEVAGMTEQQKEEVEKFIKRFEYGIIATCNPETGPRLSALNNLAGQSLKQLHFATEATTQKLANLRQDPRCEVIYSTMESGQILIGGKAEIITEEALKRELWQDWMNEYSPEGPSGQGICIIRLIPESIRTMIC